MLNMKSACLLFLSKESNWNPRLNIWINISCIWQSVHDIWGKTGLLALVLKYLFINILVVSISGFAGSWRHFLLLSLCIVIRNSPTLCVLLCCTLFVLKHTAISLPPALTFSIVWYCRLLPIWFIFPLSMFYDPLLILGLWRSWFRFSSSSIFQDTDWFKKCTARRNQWCIW